MKQKLKNKIIVFGRPAIVLSTLRCLIGTGCKADVVIVNEGYALARWSRYADKCYLIDSEEEGLELIKRKYGNETSSPIIISCNDSVAELIDQNREFLRKHFIISDSNESGEYLSYWMCKDVMCCLAEEVGFLVPKTWTLDLREGVISWNDFVYPCITKALKSSKGRKEATRICKNEEELRDAIQNAKQYTDFLLVQEFIKFDQGYCTLGVRLNRSKETIVGRTGKRHRSNLQMYGYPTFSHLEKALPPRVTEDMIRTFVERTGYTGVFSFETIVAGDKTYFVEINFRTDGKIFGMPATGCNIVAAWLYDAVGMEKYPLSFDKEVYVMFGPEDFQHVLHKDISFLCWLKDVLRTNAFHTWSVRDPMPFCILCFRKLRKILRF